MTNGNMGGIDTTSGNRAITNLNFRSGTLKNVAQINNGAGLTKTTSGTLILEGTNAYGGVTAVSEGILNIRSATALGATTAGTTVSTGSAMEIQGTITTSAEALSLSGTGISNGGALRNISDTNTYAGNTTVNEGILALSGSGSINNSAVIDVQTGTTLSIAGVTTSATIGSATAQTLKGLGSVDLGSKTLTFGNSGTLAPGNSPGTLDFISSVGGKLDFSSGSIITFELGSTSDLISFNSAGDWLTGSGNATLALSLLGGFNYASTYTIFQNGSTTGFTLANITGYDHVGYASNFAQSGNNYHISFTPIPEPHAAILGLLGTLGLLRRKR